jgi:hypothetical protein
MNRRDCGDSLWSPGKTFPQGRRGPMKQESMKRKSPGSQNPAALVVERFKNIPNIFKMYIKLNLATACRGYIENMSTGNQQPAFSV